LERDKQGRTIRSKTCISEEKTTPSAKRIETLVDRRKAKKQKNAFTIKKETTEDVEEIDMYGRRRIRVLAFLQRRACPRAGNSRG